MSYKIHCKTLAFDTKVPRETFLDTGARDAISSLIEFDFNSNLISKRAIRWKFVHKTVQNQWSTD
jgi:hypothetical protein